MLEKAWHVAIEASQLPVAVLTDLHALQPGTHMKHFLKDFMEAL